MSQQRGGSLVVEDATVDELDLETHTPKNWT